MFVPLCFVSRRQYAEWRQAAVSYRNEQTLSDYCEDCTPEYQAQMIRERRCAYPATTFDADHDGFVRGYRRESERKAAA